MYNEEIKQLLKKSYASWGYSLALQSTVKKGNKLYFYTLEKGYAEESLAVRDALNSHLSRDNIARMTEITQLLKVGKWEAPQCVCYSEQDGKWEFSVHLIQGIRYHRSRGMHVAASLILERRPFITLSEKQPESFYGYWNDFRFGPKHLVGEDQIESEGLNYRINRNLLINKPFRDFTSAFFITVANTEKKYILKDIGRVIGERGFFLPSVSFQKAIRAHTPAELLHSVLQGLDEIPLNLNRKDLNTGYVIGSLWPLISPQDRCLLARLTSETVEECISIKNLFDGINSDSSAAQFIENYYRFARCFPEREVVEIVGDYIRMSIAGKTPVRLSLSMKKLRAAHDTLMKAERTASFIGTDPARPLVRVPSAFDSLENAFDFLYPGVFQRMRTLEQLYQEGETQHNCVFSRIRLLQNDQAAIFHWNYEDKSYTIQFEKDRCGKYYTGEIRAKYNEECPSYAMSKLSEMVTAANLVKWKDPDPPEDRASSPLP